jgi:hypothetical protein
MARTHGRIVPVPRDRIIETPHEYQIKLNGRELVFFDTPGHARHHVSMLDTLSGHVFAGDTFGLSYREFDTAKGAFILPTSTPVQFEPDALHASIDRMLGFKPQQMFLTHYSRVTDVERLAGELHEQIDAMVAIGRSHAGEPDRHARIMEDLAQLYIARARNHGCAFDEARIRELLVMDIELNAQGLEVWLDRPSR